MIDCIFCKLASGEWKTNVVYQDETVFAFLDKHPINPGHILVIPKKHEPDFYKMDDTTYDAVMQTVKKLSIRVARLFSPKKVGLLVAGWDVPHAHVHVVPMNDYHDLTSEKILNETRGAPTDDELATIAASFA